MVVRDERVGHPLVEDRCHWFVRTSCTSVVTQSPAESTLHAWSPPGPPEPARPWWPAPSVGPPSLRRRARRQCERGRASSWTSAPARPSSRAHLPERSSPESAAPTDHGRPRGPGPAGSSGQQAQPSDHSMQHPLAFQRDQSQTSCLSSTVWISARNGFDAPPETPEVEELRGVQRRCGHAQPLPSATRGVVAGRAVVVDTACHQPVRSLSASEGGLGWSSTATSTLRVAHAAPRITRKNSGAPTGATTWVSLTASMSE